MKARTNTSSSSSSPDAKGHPPSGRTATDSRSGPSGITRVGLRRELQGLAPAERYGRYRELWRTAGAYNLLTDFPLHLDIELSAVCNLRCRHCFQNGLIEKDLGIMEFALYTRLIDEGVQHGLCAVKLQVRGESMLHPRFMDAVTYAKKAGVMDVQVTTNATLLSRAAAESLLDSGLDGIIFSVDPHHGSSFRRRTGDTTYDPVERNIQNFLGLKAAAGRSQPWVRIQTASVRINRRAAEKIARRIATRFPGADVIDVNRLADFRENRDAYPDLHHHYRLLPCAYPMQRLAVYWNGDVTVCCVDYNGRFQLGNAFTTPVAEIWHGSALSRIRDLHQNGRRCHLPLCRHCHACIEAERHAACTEPHTYQFDAGVLADDPAGCDSPGSRHEDSQDIPA